MNKNVKKFAFTLAESLITITIIGVVMALMLRAVTRVNPDKEKLLFIKSYHAVESVIAEVINNPAYYDQTYYTDEQITEMTNAGETLHLDFSYAPFSDVKVVTKDTTKSGLSQAEAVCYFLADKINTQGTISCGTGATDLNFKASNGVCYRGWGSTSSAGVTNGLIDPLCAGATESVTVTVYKDGKMEVASTGSANNSTKQALALEWMNNQTDFN